MGYQYQQRAQCLAYDEAIDLLRKVAPGPVVPGEADVVSDGVVSAVAGELARWGVRMADWSPAAGRFAAFARAARYRERFPDYYSGNLPEKSFEHFAAIEILDLMPHDVFLDVASERSPLPLIAAEQRRCTCFGQDYMYPPGVTSHCPLNPALTSDGSRRWWRPWRKQLPVRWLSGDACTLGLKDGFATKAAMTCSLEHFEGSLDTALIRELARVIRPGGRLVVIPLYLSLEPFTQTDPVYSCEGQVEFDTGCVIRAVRDWGNRHGRFYSAGTLRERILDPADSWFDFQVLRLRGVDAIEGFVYARFALVADRRKTPIVNI